MRNSLSLGKKKEQQEEDHDVDDFLDSSCD